MRAVIDYNVLLELLDYQKGITIVRGDYWHFYGRRHFCGPEGKPIIWLKNFN